MNKTNKEIKKTDQSLRVLQIRILYIMKYIDNLCRENGITYFIMGGTALGAVRHDGFIPWDDDLDIFMTPDQYKHFKIVFDKDESEEFVIQEWRSVSKYLEYAKVRMNGTTYIEANFKKRRDMHHGIYVDIMILHKVPNNSLIQRKIYFQSKFVTLFGLSQRNWVPKTKLQRIVKSTLKLLPSKSITIWCYKSIYKYDSMISGFKYCYWITPAKFKSGLFDKEIFDQPIEINFEGENLLAPKMIEKYLTCRYGNFLELPDKKSREAAIHAEIYDCNKSYLKYM